MRINTLILFLILIALANAVCAEEFIVTSNADDGPGTLRAAILLANANGTVTGDQITFNIPAASIQDRTIKLLTELPELTSNIIIDGSTQPGAAIGVSNAKVRITIDPNVSFEAIFRSLDSKNLEIYGIHFHEITPLVPPSNGGGKAIALFNVDNIKVGAPGKGNYFTGVVIGVGRTYRWTITGRGYVKNFSFQSNIYNLTEDGNDVYGYYGWAINLENAVNVLVGGDTREEGNFISGKHWESISIFSDTIWTYNSGYTKILNNRFGCNYAGTKILSAGAVGISGSVNYGPNDPGTTTVKYNTFDASPDLNVLTSFLTVNYKTGFIDVKANKVGVLAGTGGFGVGTAISIGMCDEGIIGGPDPEDENVLCNSRLAIHLNNSLHIEVTKNSIYCTAEGIVAQSSRVDIPVTNIFNITDFQVQGTTSIPNSLVEVFQTHKCPGCDDGEIYLGNTMSDNSGEWVFNSAVMLDGAVTATATTKSHVTGEFAKPSFDKFKLLLESPVCGQRNGSITGMKFVAGTNYYWMGSDANNQLQIYPRQEDIRDLGISLYHFVVEQGKFCSTRHSVYTIDNSPRINRNNVRIIQPSCGLDNGEITNIYPGGKYQEKFWRDAAGTIVGTESEISHLAPGSYKLVLLNTEYGCGDSTEFFTMTNQSGPSFNTQQVKINVATCSEATGSILGITAENLTGDVFLGWVNDKEEIISIGYDLLKVKPGTYRLKLKDQGACDTIKTSFFNVPDKGGISVNTDKKKIDASACNAASGSITQIDVTGGDSYEWSSLADNSIVGTSRDLFDVAPGNYRLTVKNTLGCVARSPDFTVPRVGFSPIRVTDYTAKNGFCGRPDGSIGINSFSVDDVAYTFHWMEAITGKDIGEGKVIQQLAAGTYQLVATDVNGCKETIFSSSVKTVPPPSFDYSQVEIINDECNLGKGAIRSLKVLNATGNATYEWKSQADNIAVGIGPLLRDVPAGNYSLTVRDDYNCIVESRAFVISNKEKIIAPPHYEDLIIPRHSNAMLQTKNNASGTYFLFADALGSVLLQQNQKGNFTVSNIVSDTSFFINLQAGTCKSDFVPVRIRVADQTFFKVPNAFTPNQDGINDILHVRISGYMQLKYFRIYNRWGSVVFETTRLSDGWDGIWKGVPQQTGSFVWMAEGRDIKGNPVKGQGSFVLIR